LSSLLPIEGSVVAIEHSAWRTIGRNEQLSALSRVDGAKDVPQAIPEHEDLQQAQSTLRQNCLIR
jgi:hypothetical protein